MSTTKAKFAKGDLVSITEELGTDRLCAIAAEHADLNHTGKEPLPWFPVSYFAGCTGVVVHVENHEALEFFSYFVYIRDKMYAVAEWYLDPGPSQQEGAPL